MEFQRAQGVGLTPPRGRLGHSVPTPRPLGEGLIVSNEQNNDPNIPRDRPPPLRLLDTSIASTTSMMGGGPRRESGTKPPLSPLDQIRPPLYEVDIRETLQEDWAESLEEEGGAKDTIELAKRLSQSCNSSSTCSTATNNNDQQLMSDLDKFKGDSLLSFSYQPPSIQSPLSFAGGKDDLGGSFVSAFSHSLNSSFNLPFVTSPTKDKETFLYPTVARNPNKALLTIDAKSSLILVANEGACHLFGYRRSDLVGLKIQHLFDQPYTSHQRALVEENIDSTGETVLISGKVMDAVTSYGLKFPVSVWMRKVVSCSPDPRCIIVVEPVERCFGQFTVDEKGIIVDCDDSFYSIFGYPSESSVINRPILTLIPSLNISHPSPTDEELSLTGRTKDGTAFPLEVIITSSSIEACGVVGSPDDTSCDQPRLRALNHGKVMVYASLNGMVCLNDEGTIIGCNHHFALMLFGYTQQELLNKDITFIMPKFHSHLSDIIEEDEEGDEVTRSDVSLPIHPLFIHEAQLASCTKDQDVEVGVGPSIVPTRGSSKGEDLFYSVSERSISLEYGLDSHLASISEEGSDVFVTNPPLSAPTQSEDDGKSVPSSTDMKCDSSVITDSRKDSDLNNGRVRSDEVVIQFLPHVVSVGDSSFEYDNASDEDSAHDVNDSAHDISDSAHGIDSSAHSISDSALISANNPTSRDHDDVIPLENELAKLDMTQEDPPPVSSSTPCRILSRPNSRLSSIHSRAGGYPEGTYLGTIRHRDSTLMSVVFELKEIVLKSNCLIYCIWLSRQLDYRDHNLTEAVDSFGILETTDKTTSDPLLLGSSTGTAEEMAVASQGKYTEAYETLGPIGRGAFGFVKLAKRLEDSLMVVVKFIKKASVIEENWVDHDTMGVVPREICLLAGLSHPNIIQLLEAYENEKYFQLVMEKHGDGMDLFSFIDSGPCLDEALISYMFRQIVAGLSYLHGNNILHRDIKDENIVLDQSFHVKIIDFGSAVMMEEGKLFSTFCGTLEYCSPEVLLGNRYAGPELEMWSLGVTLYTMVYSENPFFDVDEIISGRLQPPYFVSPGLMKVMLWLLHPDPTSRANLHDLVKDKWVNQAVQLSDYSFDSILAEGKRRTSLALNQSLSSVRGGNTKSATLAGALNKSVS